LTVFFVLSKLLAFFTQASNLIILLGLAGLVLTRTRFSSAGRRLAAGSLILIGLISFLPLDRVLSISLENRFPRWDPTGIPPAGIVVLGGAVSAIRGEVSIRDAADRVIVVPMLANRYPAARIIYSGGDAGLFVHHGSEADLVTGLFENLGVPPSRLTLEDRSRNTIENATYSKALAQPKPGERWLVVTSVLHMPRAIGAFRQAGFAVEAYPVDYRTGGWEDILVGGVSGRLRGTDKPCMNGSGSSPIGSRGKPRSCFRDLGRE
jgi:uncharacterized SAM-binding protein YcdF (DUF218 family)